MSNAIELLETVVSGDTIKYRCAVTGGWRNLFAGDEFEITYSCTIDSTPESIAVIPFLCVVLPLAWLFDGRVLVNDVDESFYNSLAGIKSGYREMYPDIDFKGSCLATKITNNVYSPKNNAVAMFSGGLDSFFTLVSHAREALTLVTLWGADIDIQKPAGWDLVEKQNRAVAEDFGKDIVFVKTGYRSLLDTRAIDANMRGWTRFDWDFHFSHGLAYCGHLAPLVFLLQSNVMHIPSSYSDDARSNVLCASDPRIDGHVSFAGCTINHDGHEYSRQDKARAVCNYAAESGKEIYLRVCPYGAGVNCCRCEKCYRTVYGVWAEGADPQMFGFDCSDEMDRHASYLLRKKLTMGVSKRRYWQEIWRRAVQTYPDRKAVGFGAWLLATDFSRIDDSFYKKQKRFFNKLKHKLFPRKSK